MLAHLAAIHAIDPLDHILITGDMTDAGRASEWAAFLDAIARHPELAARMVMLPGNHDVNIVDRANPARLDLPFSPGKRLRQIRTLSAMAAVQGDRVRVVDATGKPTRNAATSTGAASRGDRGAWRNMAACAVQRRCVACSTTCFR